MSARSIELRGKRAKIVADSRAMLDKAKTETRALTSEEDGQWKRMMDEVDTLKSDIDREERQEALDLEVAATQERRSSPPNPGELEQERRNKEKQLEKTEPKHRRESDEYRAMFRKFLSHGYKGFGPDESRALQSDLDVSGGYLAAPVQVVNELLKGVDNETFMLANATVIDVTEAKSLGVPTLDADPDDADWTSELDTGNEDSAMAFGKRELVPHPVAKRLKISNKLLRLVPNVESLVTSRLQYKFGVTIEKAGMTGTGAQQPLGVFVASTDGVPTTQDSATAVSLTLGADDFITVKYALKPQYWPRAKWLMHRDRARDTRKLKSTATGQYLWQVGGLDAGIDSQAPDLILGLPVGMSEYAPNGTTAGSYIAALADFKFYWFARALGMSVQRLEELYAATNQIGLIGRMEIDGMPVLSEAFRRLKYLA